MHEIQLTDEELEIVQDALFSYKIALKAGGNPDMKAIIITIEDDLLPKLGDED